MINGHFLPKRLVINPKMIFPKIPPKNPRDTTHDASSIVILPDGSGVSSDINKIILGLAHPPVLP